MIYFDNAATSKYKPKCAVKALARAYADSANSGRGGHDDAVKTAVAIDRVRRRLLAQLGADDSYELVFTKNCTEALNLALFGTVKRGANALSTVMEHNSVLRPLYKLNKEKQIKLNILNPDKRGLISPTHLDRMIADDTYLVAVNAVSNVTGAENDLDEIAKTVKKRGVMLLVDGAQAVPHGKINVKEQGIDMLAAAGHKGLHGPQGTGFLIFKKNLNIKPLLYGGTGTNSDSVYQPFDAPEGLESGTLNGAGIIALGAAAHWSYSNLEKINAHVSALSDYVLYNLKNTRGVEVYTPDGTKSGVISFNVGDRSSYEIADVLNEKYDVAVRPGLHCAPLMHNYLGTLERGAVRVSVGYNNTEKDAHRLICAIKELAMT